LPTFVLWILAENQTMILAAGSLKNLIFVKALVSVVPVSISNNRSFPRSFRSNR
jgi:hypothetical protein